MKRLEKRLENVEKWLKEFEKGTGPAQTRIFFSKHKIWTTWLVDQVADLGGHCVVLAWAPSKDPAPLQGPINFILPPFGPAWGT